jgi:phosphoglycolate phosphatase-like HAD superfamily hydrolase
VKLFLFDIDGTPVTARGAGRAAFNHALVKDFSGVAHVVSVLTRG